VGFRSRICAAALVAALTLSCAKTRTAANAATSDDRKDLHSFGNPDQVRVTHVDLDLDVRFEQRVLNGSALLTVERAPGFLQGPLILDTRALNIARCECSADSTSFAPCHAEMGKQDPILGSPLRVDLPENARFVRVWYSTSPEASGLQWLTPAQTSSKKYPFLFSQSQAINARSWVPLQDSPGVRVTYGAKIRTPKDLFAVMSAENDPAAPRNGEFSFQLREPIPPYLMAIAVGDIVFRPLTKRTGVFAEREVVDKAASEFADMNRMLEAGEALYGPYRWGRYDVLVLPPSFPFGGMENARLTFATPTILAGDKSLVDTIAHELAHSWSGNLVTNATWRDFWLNEGITTYLSMRIMETVYGPARAEMEGALEKGLLLTELARLPAPDQVLHIDLKDRDPDQDGMTEVPYAKGMLFLRLLEDTFGRERFDPFLRSYFQHFAFQSVTTEDFASFLKSNLFDSDPALARTIPLDQWLYQPGLPADAPKMASSALAKVDALAGQWTSGRILVANLPGRTWTTHEWLEFLRTLPPDIGRERMGELDRTFHLTASTNAEITAEWLKLAVRNRYQPADAKLEQFLTTVGRRKYIDPLYTELVKTPEGRQRANAIFLKARPGYHPLTVEGVQAILNGPART